MVVLSPADPDIDFMIECKPERMCSSRVLAFMLFAYLLQIRSLKIAYSCRSNWGFLQFLILCQISFRYSAMFKD